MRGPSHAFRVGCAYARQAFGGQHEILRDAISSQVAKRAIQQVIVTAHLNGTLEVTKRLAWLSHVAVDASQIVRRTGITLR